MVSRVERTAFANWWWTVDRLMLAALFALMLGGIVLSLAASPPVAGRLGLDPFYFVNRHVLYLIPAVCVMLGVNLQPSEFLKPAFVILIAWLFAEQARRPEMPTNPDLSGRTAGWS
jgi:cell division protein FtsW